MILLKQELNAIGNNFNQAVKKLHNWKRFPAINIPEKSEPRVKSKLQTIASGITKQEGKELPLEKPQAKQSIQEPLMNPQPNFSNTPLQLKRKKRKQRRLGL